MHADVLGLVNRTQSGRWKPGDGVVTVLRQRVDPMLV